MTVDIDQIRRLMAALYAEGDRFYLGHYREKPEKVWKEGRHLYASDRVSFLGNLVAVMNGSLMLGVAVSLATFSTTRREQDALALQALGIDIDGKDIEKLKPGSSVGEVVPVVLDILKGRGVVPHALVHSGHGLHVYLLIERQDLTQALQRHRVKTAWFRLCHVLGGATDRFDLSSYLRLPGTTNRKNGGAVPCRFIEEHTNLSARRYSLAEIEKALEDVEVVLPEKAARTNAKDKTGDGQQVLGVEGREPPELTVEDQKLLEAAEILDPKFLEYRRASREGDADHIKGKRSGADYRYAATLIEYGFPQRIAEAEIAVSQKAREEGIHYASVTVDRVAPNVIPGFSRRPTVVYEDHQIASEALYSLSNRDETTPPSSLSLSLSRGSGSASDPDPEPKLPRLLVTRSRPGAGKTVGTIIRLAQDYGVGHLGFSGQFVEPLMRHEAEINGTWPYGRDEQPLDVPETHEALRDRLPGDIREQERDGQRVWSLDTLKTAVTSPAAFFINSRHPGSWDERLGALTDDDARREMLQRLDPKRWNQPQAVMKFHGRWDLCLKGLSPKDLRSGQMCRSCEWTACRANNNKGGAKTYWSEAFVSLLTHRAFQVQVAFRPALHKHFEAMVFDEVPQGVFRYPVIKVMHENPQRRGSKWIVDLIEKTRSAFEKHYRNEPTVLEKGRPVFETMEARARKLIGVAKKLRSEAMDPDLKKRRVPTEHRVGLIEPLIDPGDFKYLVEISSAQADDPEEDAEDESAQSSSYSLSTLLLKLRDFSGVKPLNVYMEQSFNERGGGELLVCRPVDAWGDYLRRREGKPDVTMILDATAGMDPRYRLLGLHAFESFETVELPNTTFVVTSEKTQTKTAVKKLDALELAAHISTTVRPHLDSLAAARDPGGTFLDTKLLIVTDIAKEKQLTGAVAALIRRKELPAVTSVDHFGNLRGKNLYRDFDAIWLTQAHRYDPLYYQGLSLLLRDFEGYPGQWSHKVFPGRGPWDDSNLVTRAMVCDMVQDLMRIGIRSDPTRRAVIFLPTPDPRFVIRLMQIFRGATWVLPDGSKIGPIEKQAPAPPASETETVLEQQADDTPPTQPMLTTNVRQMFGGATDVDCAAATEPRVPVTRKEVGRESPVSPTARAELTNGAIPGDNPAEWLRRTMFLRCCEHPLVAALPSSNREWTNAQEVLEPLIAAVSAQDISAAIAQVEAAGTSGFEAIERAAEVILREKMPPALGRELVLRFFVGLACRLPAVALTINDERRRAEDMGSFRRAAESLSDAEIDVIIAEARARGRTGLDAIETAAEIIAERYLSPNLWQTIERARGSRRV